MEREAHIKSNYIRAQGMDHKFQVFHLHQNSKRSRPRIQGRPAQKVKFVNNWSNWLLEGHVTTGAFEVR